MFPDDWLKYRRNFASTGCERTEGAFTRITARLLLPTCQAECRPTTRRQDGLCEPPIMVESLVISPSATFTR